MLGIMGGVAFYCSVLKHALVPAHVTCQIIRASCQSPPRESAEWQRSFSRHWAGCRC